MDNLVHLLKDSSSAETTGRTEAHVTCVTAIYLIDDEVQPPARGTGNLCKWYLAHRRRDPAGVCSIPTTFNIQERVKVFASLILSL